MTIWVTRSFRTLALLNCLIWAGCLPPAQSQLDEEKEPHFLAGKARFNAMDYKGAIEAFDKALTVNPQSASTHFELGCLYDRHDQKDPDPAAAIYHYEHYLKLRPKADNAEIVQTRILACKQELARSVNLGTLTQGLQNEFEKLRQENQDLRQQLQQCKAYASRLQAMTNQIPNPAVPARLAMAPSSGPAARSPSQSNSAPKASGTANSSPTDTQQNPTVRNHTHTIKPGENPTAIAKKYGVKVDALMAANPGVDARRLLPGQTLNIPSP
ncbi:MAG: hypothetical protein DME25_09420 [Verrucomicrobia bacterium]|nr:MAG: hypothetical protein DME25_09420 [Verrucomicrobiota bacterium]